MYPAPYYTETDPAFAAAVMQKHSFACLTSIADGKLKATHAPLTLRAEEGPNGTIYGHLATQNPQVSFFDGLHEAMAVFTGPHAYISPTWKREPSSEVPTWDYVSVQASGRPEALPVQEAGRLIGDLVEAFEGQGGWQLTAMKPSFREKLLLRVTAFRMPIEHLICVRKLHQGRAAERPLIIARLRELGEKAAADALLAVIDDA